MATKHRGAEIHKGAVRISIKWRGKWVYETTGFKPTDAGLASAAKLRAEIVEKERNGRFIYNEYFPNSKRARVSTDTVYDFAKKYIDYQRSEIAASTLKGYRKMLNNYWLPQIGALQIADVNTGSVRDAIHDSGLAELTAKTFNNAMTPLRGVFELARDYEIIARNPCDKIKSKKHQTPPPDPLSLDEMHLVLNHIRPDWRPYFQVAFGTGMRTSELIALRWGDIDFNSGLIQVERGYVEQQEKGTKTSRVRQVEVNSLAMTGLKAQKSVTFLAGDLVFLSNGQQINNDKPPRLIWDAALKRAGVRHRKAYCTRHTFITAALSFGKSPYLVAQQAGNSVRMIETHYAKWIKQSAESSMSDLVMISKQSRR